jgi:aspartate aminotransferase
MKELSSVMSKFEPSATLKISRMIKDYRTGGFDVVDFGIGEPNFDLFDNIKQAGIAAINNNKNRYTPVSGIPALKKAIIEKFRKENNIEYSNDQIVVSNGAKHTLHNVISILANPGDEFIISRPYWVSYNEQVKLPGGIPIISETDEKFNVRADYIREKITPNTKAIILNSPCNPTGSVISHNELKRIGDLALQNDLYIISDEVYEYFIYDDNTHHSIASFDKELHDRTITVNACSKSYSMTGLRIGYSGGPEHIMKLMDTLQSQTTSGASSIAQEMAAVAFSTQKEKIEEIRKGFLKKRDICVKTLREGGFDIDPPHGAFYLFPSIKFTGLSSEEFCHRLMDQEKVGVVPGDAFGAEGYIRINYAVPEDTLVDGLSRINNFVRKL